MSASTSSYSSLLGGMWGPEGSEINERLKRLQELEQMRKEREAKRQALLKDSGKGVSIVRTARVNSVEPETSSRYGIRRTLSLREDENSNTFGGARPKMAGSYVYGQEEQTQDGNIFSGTINELLSGIGLRKPLRGTRDTGSNYADKSYSLSYSNPEEEFKKNVFGDFRSTFLNKPSTKSRTYTSSTDSEPSGTESVKNGYSEHYDDGHTNNVFENTDNNEQHEDDVEEDHGEEPLHFIERLKNGNGTSKADTYNYSSKHSQSIPTVPPFRHRDSKNNTGERNTEELPELVQPTDDILSVAQEISSTFGNFKSPTGLTPSRKYSRRNIKTSEAVEDPNVSYDIVQDPNVSYDIVQDPDGSVTYEIVEVDFDTSADERGKLLAVNDSFYQADPSEWDGHNLTPGKLDKMHEFFTGEAIGEDPNISRELDGTKVKAELEKSFSKTKTPKSDKNGCRKTPTSMRKSVRKENKVIRSKSPLDKLKSSESENESAHTSESEVDSQKMKLRTPVKASTPNSTRKSEKNGMSLSDKLAKLESLTQEKKRKHSFSENENKNPVPSYMSETNASQKKKSRAKDMSPKPARDLKKDVRELKQFVHQHTSEPNTPVSSPTKLFTEVEIKDTEHKSTREISVQTEFVIDFPDITYVCKHCGKSSFEEVGSPLTKENLTKTFEKKTKRESPDSDKAKTAENKISSKDSVKSFGELSTKSEKGYRYKPKAVSGTQGYMKGTTSSRLKNTGNLSSTDGKIRKGSAPDIVHIAEAEGKSTSLRGIVSQKTKAIENASRKEKNKPQLSVFRASSVDRDNANSEHKPRGQLAKSKSSDQVNVLKNGVKKATETEKQTAETSTIKKESSEVCSVPPSSGEEKSLTQMRQKIQSPAKAETKVEKLDLSSLDTPKSQVSPRSPVSLRKPPLASPRARDTPISPRSETSEVFDDNASVESKGQFTTIDDNPFIRNDTKRRNSLRGHDKGESVWEKAESRSRDSSLQRSNSASEADRERPASSSSLKREKSSLSELTWSDSGSTGSLRGSKSSLHGSNTSLNRDSRSAFIRPRTVSNSSATSQTCHNAVLNLLSPIGTTRHPVSGAMETDIDAAYSDHVKEKTVVSKADEHNEETVNRAHLDFAKKACDMLEFDLKKRDSSNESDREKNNVDDNKDNNNYKNQNGGENHGLVNGTEVGKKEKGKKGFLKGKLFRK